MSSKIIMKPKEFEQVTDTIRSGGSKIRDLKLVPEKGTSKLKSIDEMEKVIESLNNAIQNLASLHDLDVHAMERFKATWMQTDETGSLISKSGTEVSRGGGGTGSSGGGR